MTDRIRFLMCIVLKILMDIFFVSVVAQKFPYDYYEVNGNAIRYLISWGIVLVIYLLMPQEERSVKAFFMHVQFVIMILPLTTLYAFTVGKSTKYILVVTVAVLLECLILRKPGKVYYPVKITGIKPYISVLVIVGLPVCLILILNHGGFNGLEAFHPAAVTAIRKSASYPVWLNYAIMWCIYVIIPFFMVYCLENKKYLAAVLLVLGDLVIYMVVAKKIIYLSIVVILAVYVAARLGQAIRIMYLGMSTLLGTITVFHLVERNGQATALTNLLASFVGERFLFTSAFNKFAYYEVFREYPKLYFSDGLIGKCLGLADIYRWEPGQMIFGYVWNGRFGESNSCTGYLGDGYAQLGVAGIFLCAAVIGFLIRYIDRYKNTFAFAILAPMAALYAVILNDTPLQTTLVSCGLFLFLILLAVYGEKREERRI